MEIKNTITFSNEELTFIRNGLYKLMMTMDDLSLEYEKVCKLLQSIEEVVGKYERY